MTQAAMPEKAEQLLPREAYVSQDWFDRENRTLFAKAWGFAGISSDIPKVGDYLTAKVGTYTLFIIRGSDGELRAFHNVCRHRGAELVDLGCGNAGKTIVCPYHRWTYGLDGALRGVPDQKALFPDFDKKANGLHRASVGVLRDLIFVNPEPDMSFDTFLATVPDVVWPHDLQSSELQDFGETVTYEMECNWKVFFENAVDGYHLVYLHEHTLGGPVPEQNVWEVHGDHQVWYSTENDNLRTRTPNFVTEYMDRWRAKRVPHAAEPGYGGVYALFPVTLIVPTPWSFSVSWLEPVSPDKTLMHVRVWGAKSWLGQRGSVKDVPGYDPESGRIKSSRWRKHPLETGDFQTEDVYVAEKVQRSMHSPKYAVASLAQGHGAETPLTFFQGCVLRHLQD